MKDLIILIIVVLCVVVCAYVINLLICFGYCRQKEMNVHTEENSSSNCNEAHKEAKIITRIKLLFNGWILYNVDMLGKVPSQRYRIFILKHIFRMKIQKHVVIYGGFRIRAPWNISIGSGTIIGNGCELDGRNGLEIGSNVNISTNVLIYTEQHDVNDAYFESNSSGGRVVINDRVWLSSRTIVLPKVKVGEGAVLASGGLACKDLAPFTIYGGVPANNIGERNNILEYEFDGEFIPFI